VYRLYSQLSLLIFCLRVLAARARGVRHAAPEDLACTCACCTSMSLLGLMATQLLVCRYACTLPTFCGCIAVVAFVGGELLPFCCSPGQGVRFESAEQVAGILCLRADGQFMGVVACAEAAVYSVQG